ncbi:cysteine rich repeat-containing protein, partial [Acidisphaera rubrifaciens]|uniref:cysteine rich repeat-containing protein n=1 Tax=Acidisphaera rubrifaciens TaxID=50715 RepID=UPI0018F226CB
MQRQGWVVALCTALLLCHAGAAMAQGTPTQAQASAIRSACRADYQAHCAGVPTGGAASLSCLQANAAAVSQPCRNALAAVSGAASPTA